MTEAGGSGTKTDSLRVALVAVVAHATAIGCGFVWLDHAHIEGELALATPRDWSSLFTQSFAGTGFYRPLMALSLSLDALVSTQAWYFHVVTLAWHALASALVVLAAYRLGSNRRAALGAGYLFAAHPLNSLVASAIAFRSEAMALAFLLLLVVSHLEARPYRAALAVAAGALSKETAWLLSPLLVAYLEFVTRRAGDVRRAERVRRLLAAELAAFALVSILHAAFAPHFRALYQPLAWQEQVGSRLAALAKGAIALAFPFPYTVCDAFHVTGLMSASALLGAALLLWLFVTRACREPAKGLLLLGLLPALQLAPIMRWWSPHYFYIPLAFAALGFCDTIERRVTQRMLPALVLAACVGLSLNNGLRFRDDTSLWSAEVTREPACREGHFYLAEVARERHEWERAVYHYDRAVRGTPGVLAYADELSSYQNLGATELMLRHFDRARVAFERALEKSHDRERARQLKHNLLMVALAAGDRARAVSLLASAQHQAGSHAAEQP